MDIFIGVYIYIQMDIYVYPSALISFTRLIRTLTNQKLTQKRILKNVVQGLPWWCSG